MSKTAIVILNWNGSALLKKFLPSVLAAMDAGEAEVYVADNASTDDSCQMLAQDFPDVHLIKLAQNWGFAEGYNKALAQVEAEYVVLLNSDVEVTKGWLKPLTGCLDRHPEVAACQPKIRSYHAREFFEYAGASGGFIDYYGYPFCRGRIFSSLETDEGQYDTEMPVFWATGAALCIRLDEYRKAGGLDGRFFAHMEEIDLCWRLRSRGKKILCVPASVVYHVGGGTLKKENPRKTYLNFRNNLLMLYKNLPDGELQKVMRGRFWLDLLALLMFMLKGDFPNAKAVIKARRDFGRMKAEFKASRQENMQQTIVKAIPQRLDCCLVWQYYVRGKHLFSDFFE